MPTSFSRVSAADIDRQKNFCAKIKEKYTFGEKYVYMQTFGCQQNEADSEKLLYFANLAGYKQTFDQKLADLIIVNTCAVREHAELKALSITGQFKHLKEQKPDLIIAMCGCMVSQEFRKDDIKFKYPYVSFLLTTNMLWKFPEVLYNTIKTGKRQICLEMDTDYLYEGIDSARQSDFKAWVSIMNGCNNFCTYCIVPYVRGRERSRSSKDILCEVECLVKRGYKEITLLGQNVNSYSPEGEDCSFAKLLEKICAIDGDFIVRFMTSHPKDASDELIRVIAENKKIARHFHLPLQSGSDEILKKMNRRYDRKHYFELVSKIRQAVPDIAITSDIIVGFPGESDEDFEYTLDALKTVRFDNIFSFVYSPRRSTPAAAMECQIPEDVKAKRMEKLLAVQREIIPADTKNHIGKTLRVLVEGRSEVGEKLLSGRTETNKLVYFEGDDSLIGEFCNVKIERSDVFVIYGSISK
ncbi:MAG: tRNA (N6-isopentenyl adenosine(37)-C2)-methylthiotransferase MiaB [Clostridia bacterium]|nr:tRNA (N6-isopentenyl adenosine(37)-C2)-methylthiotransferase MiaB [Clostridia bacterium]